MDREPTDIESFLMDCAERAAKHGWTFLGGVAKTDSTYSTTFVGRSNDLFLLTARMSWAINQHQDSEPVVVHEQQTVA
jgi:hypothetical protein